ncbi:hypothetical protein [Urbifossiella limnaea]|uniref:Uncharacterized protein n=1 Tax=Urbifossiella limnaea TaxID=2528023 RepID=A0A517XL41_9BACT|nr:hypothetical protein [Urbifossiella limnaea]QDU18223.1 hypothetical protein ETAA1_01060 [Urbifossiella limnaea]
MQLYCPACQSAFTGVSRCPRCAGLLLMPEEAAFLAADPDAAAPRPDRPTAAGRLVVGTVAALGAYLALRKFLTGWAAATAADADGWWATDDALVAVLVLQAVSAVFGSLLAGAGRSGGLWLGCVVGGTTGGLFLAAEVAGGAPPGYLVLLVQPAVLAVLGGVAGALGGRVWAGVPELDMPTPAVRRSSSINLGEVVAKPQGRPTVWWKVLAGGAVVVVGVGFADPARRLVERNSKGALRTASMGQARFLSAQLATLAVLGGAALAAAGTGAGVRHGILAGVFGAAGVAGLTLAQGALPAPAGYLAEHMNLDAADGNNPLVLGAVGFGLVVAGVVGGWLGGTLFLPLAPPNMRRGRARLA